MSIRKIVLILILLVLSVLGCSDNDDDENTLGERCGGLVAGSNCDGNTFCQFPKGTCGAADETGLCVTKAQVCTMIYSPVCGCDGNTYGSECMAEAAGVSIVSNGECPAQ